MSESRIPREPAAAPQESFQINDPVVGKTFSVRECTDEQLTRYAASAQENQKACIQQVLQLLGQAQQAGSMAYVLQYELDRRRRSITLATGADLSNLRRQ
jgi:hypothetical protein